VKAPTTYSVRCRRCGGSGRCPVCHGSGLDKRQVDAALATPSGKCESCGGAKTCVQCRGAGRYAPYRPVRLTRDTPDPGFVICPACNGSLECTVCWGTTVTEDGGTCMSCDHGACDECDQTGQVPVGELARFESPPRTDATAVLRAATAEPRAAALADPSIARTITFEQGHPTAADSPWGFQRVRISTAGDLEYEHRSRSGQRVVRGRVDVARARGVFAALARTRFPEPPQATFKPGTSVLALTVAPPGARVLIDYFDGLDMDGYRDVIRELSGLNNALREGDQDALKPWWFEPTPDPGTP